MGEPKDAEGNSGTESSPATSLPLQDNAHSDPGDPSLPVINEKSESINPIATVDDSEVSVVKETPDGPSLEQQSTISPEISNDKEHKVNNNVTASLEGLDIQDPQFLGNSKAEINDIPRRSVDDVSVNISSVQINDDCNSSSEIKVTEGRLHAELGQHQMEDGSTPNKTPELAHSSEHIKHVQVNRGLVDTAAPFESVKEAVTKFGGIVDWKAHKAITLERRKHVQLELEKVQEEIPVHRKQSEAAEDAKVQVLKELDSTKRLVEELKLSFEKAQTEEAQAKQDSELAQLRVTEMEQGIADEASVAAKAQLEVAKGRHAAAVEELKSIKHELETMRAEYASLVKEGDVAIKKAEEAVSASKDIEKTVEDLTLELIVARESLESAHAAHLEAEEHRIGAALARDQDSFNWEKELKQEEDELKRLNDQLSLASDLQSKLDTASKLLLDLKGELAAYMEAKLNQESESIEGKNLEDGNQEKKKTHASIQASVASVKKELDEVKVNIEKANEEVKCLRVAAVSLKTELEREKAALAPMRQREGMASIAVSSLEAELSRTISEIESIQTKEKAARGQIVELPKALQQAAREADEAKSVAQSAQEELRKAKEEAEQAEASASTINSRLHAALKEIEAAKASERLALAAVNALQGSEQAASMGGDDSPTGVTLPLEEYYMLSKRAHEAEELANERVVNAISQIEVARESELRSLERLEEANRELARRKEALRAATEKAEKAKEGKLGVEQELRKWRAEHERRRKAGDAAQLPSNPTKSPPKSFEEHREPKSFVKEQETSSFVRPAAPPPKIYMPENSRESVVKKKKSIFPRIVTFLARKKT